MTPLSLKTLPPIEELETKPILKSVSQAHRYLAELKGLIQTIPNQSILINTLGLQEAKNSSEIESIITTHDEMYKAELNLDFVSSSSAKEVQSYAEALRMGFGLVKKINY